MRRWATSSTILACFLFAPPVWAGSAGGAGLDAPPSHGSRPMRPYPDRLATLTVGIAASYARFDFPNSNTWLRDIVSEIEKEAPGIVLEDLETGLGVYAYAQMLIWEGFGFRLGILHTKDRTTTMEPGGHGPVRAEVEARTSPVNLTYSLVREFWLEPVWITVGVGVDQYRWEMDWLFYEDDRNNAMEEWEWKGRGTGGHGFLEIGVSVGGIQVQAGTAYHKGVVDMDVQLPVVTNLAFYPRHFEEDVDNLHFYGGVVFDVF